MVPSHMTERRDAARIYLEALCNPMHIEQIDYCLFASGEDGNMRNRDPATARGFDLASKLSPKLRRARTTRSSGQSPILARACWCSAALPIFRTIGMAWLASVYTICPLRDVWKWVVNGWSALGCRCARYLGHELGVGSRTA